jgi:D-beta-D-heptose 7-phosphate kinase/D-beta-D-heptose 1-phosphate adenosyltransferase
MLSDIQKLSHTIDHEFPRHRVLVIGDVMLDQYIWGTVDRISPEAPVPVIRREHETFAAGGAANVALNLIGLGLEVELIGLRGDDFNGNRLAELLRAAGVSSGLITTDRVTTRKTRIMSGHQQLLRIDDEVCCSITPAQEVEVRSAFDRSLAGISAIVVSDYAKGMVTADICCHVIEHGRRQGIPVLMDPKGSNYSKYKGATAICPNRSELAQIVHASPRDIDTLLDRSRGLRRELALDWLLVTLSEHGIAIVGEGGIDRFPAQAKEVFDVSGAGDCVIATVAACLGCGLRLSDAVQLANIAAGIVVSKAGTVPVSASQLKHAIHGAELELSALKNFAIDQLGSQVVHWKMQGERIVFTNGCFDLLHVGHVSLLQKAKQCGTKLIVGINSDESVRRLKGPLRPIMDQWARAQLLSQMSSVDAVVIFDEDNPLRLIDLVKPDVLVKGGDYMESTVIGAELVKGWGGRVELVELIPGVSTTQLIRKSEIAKRATN